MPLALEQINIVVRDMQRSLAFYRLLGVSIEETRGAEWEEWARHHVNGTAANGVRVEFDSVAFAKQWNPGFNKTKLGSALIPIFHVASREEVDRVHAHVTAAGHRSHKAPEPIGRPVSRFTLGDPPVPLRRAASGFPASYRST